jgi:hypothetical protein
MPLWSTYSSEYARPTGFVGHLESLVWGTVYVQEEYEWRNPQTITKAIKLYLKHKFRNKWWRITKTSEQMIQVGIHNEYLKSRRKVFDHI